MSSYERQHDLSLVGGHKDKSLAAETQVTDVTSGSLAK